jgi:hypothetical protein
MTGHPANVKTRDTVVAALTFTTGFIDFVALGEVFA